MPHTSAAPRRFTALWAAVPVLIAMFVAVPGPLAAGRWRGGLTDQGILAETLRTAFAGYWATGDRPLTPALRTVVDYWLRFHVIKAGIAVVTLGVLVVLGRRLWRAYSGADGGRGRIAAAGAVMAMLGMLALVSAVANIQGAAAPLASLLPMLMSGPRTGATASTLDEIHGRLTAGAHTPAALGELIDDFAVYHAALAVVVALVAALLLGLAVLIRRRYAAVTDRPSRRLLLVSGVLVLMAAGAFLVVAAANTSTALNPAPALADFFAGGW